MVGTRSLIPKIGALSLLVSTALGSNIFRREEDSACQCTPENQVVRYIVVEMPPQPSKTAAADVVSDTLEPAAIAALVESEKDVETSAQSTAAKQNATTTTLGPIKAPNVNVSSPEHIIPAQTISLFYGTDSSNTTASTATTGSTVKTAPTYTNNTVLFSNVTTTTPSSSGSINMTLTTNQTFVALENIGSVINVNCTDDGMTVKFDSMDAFQTAAEHWLAVEAGLVIVTSDQGNCNTEFERGFFKAENILADESELSISCTASKQKIEEVAGLCEMTFSSLPAATLRRRITLSERTGLSFDASLPSKKTLLNYPPYVTISANEASFDTEVTFSGSLKYNILGFKLQQLYFDLDASFDAKLGLEAAVYAAYNHTFEYSPDALTYSLVEVPGVVSLGPGVAFGIGLDLSTSGAVDVTADLSVGMPSGALHIDFLDKTQSKATGWTPTYSATADINEQVEVGADVFAKLSVELAVKVLGGLLDLSSGISAVPRVNNDFTLTGNQVLSASGTGKSVTTSVSQPSSSTNSCSQGVNLKSAFVFELQGFVTKYWKKTLYSVSVPIADKCWNWAK